MGKFLFLMISFVAKGIKQPINIAVEENEDLGSFKTFHRCKQIVTGCMSLTMP